MQVCLCVCQNLGPALPSFLRVALTLRKVQLYKNTVCVHSRWNCMSHPFGLHKRKSINFHPRCHSRCSELERRSGRNLAGPYAAVTEVSPFSVYDSSRMRLFRLSYRTDDRVPCSQWADFIGLYYWVRLHVAVAVCVWLGNKPSVTVTFISRNSLSLSLSVSLVFFFVSLSLKGSLGKK